MLTKFYTRKQVMERTGVEYVEQKPTIGMNGRRVYDGPVTLHYTDGRTVCMTSACVCINVDNVNMFAERAYRSRVPAYLDREPGKAADL